MNEMRPYFLFLCGCVSAQGIRHIETALIDHLQLEDRPPDTKSEFSKFLERFANLIIHYETESKPEAIFEQQSGRFKRNQGMNCYNRGACI